MSAGRHLQLLLSANKQNIKLAWRISIDWCVILSRPPKHLSTRSTSYRTLLPLIYPPHTLALGSIYVAALLLSFEKPEIPIRDADDNLSPAVIAEKMNDGEVYWEWQEFYRTTIQDVDGDSLLSFF